MEHEGPPDGGTFGCALRAARQSAGLSLAQLGYLTHYSKGYLSRIESGQRQPTVQLAGQCDKLLGAGGTLLARVPAVRPARRSAEPGIRLVRPFQLPSRPTLFTGRERELDCLDAALTPGGHAVPVVISGMGGVGKTALALAWAHRSAHHFTDGALFADLSGFGPASPPVTAQDVQTAFLHALGVSARLMPESAAQLAGLYRSVLHDRRILMVLDNAADAGQVRPLLPGSPSVALLVTSRSRMTGLCARDGAISMPLDPLAPDESRALAAAILGDANQEALSQLTEACGHLPLAIRLGAHRLAALDPGALAAGARTIADRGTRMKLLRSPGDPESDPRAVLQWSYDALPATARRAIGLLAQYAGPDLTRHVAAVLMETGLPAAERLLADLVQVHLLQEGAPGRFRFHDLFRLFAAERAAPDPDALRRLGNWYVTQVRTAAATAAPQLTRLPWHPHGQSSPGNPVAAKTSPAYVVDDAEGALGFIDDERHNLLAIIELCAAHDLGEISWLLADAARGYYYHKRYLGDWARAAETGLRMARQRGDHAAIAAMLSSQALSACATGRFRRAAPLSQAALRHATQGSWAEGIAMITGNLGMIYFNTGQLQRAGDAYATALAANQETGNRRGEAVQLGNLAGVHHALGQAAEALHLYREALAIHSAAGAHDSAALMHVNQANVYITLGKPECARAAAAEASDIYQARGSRLGTCLAETALARALLACGDAGAAAETARQARDDARAIGDQRIEADALNALGEAAAAAGDLTDAATFLADACNLATTIAYDHGRRDAQTALKALESAHSSDCDPTAGPLPVAVVTGSRTAEREIELAARAGPDR